MGELIEFAAGGCVSLIVALSWLRRHRTQVSQWLRAPR
jgi:hypothetical protein